MHTHYYVKFADKDSRREALRILGRSADFFPLIIRDAEGGEHEIVEVSHDEYLKLSKAQCDISCVILCAEELDFSKAVIPLEELPLPVPIKSGRGLGMSEKLDLPVKLIVLDPPKRSPYFHTLFSQVEPVKKVRPPASWADR